jgi:hypothetical protein
METYKIIYDENELDKFISFLPNLKENERYYWSLFARKKYSTSLIKSNDKTQLKRGVATKENLKDKIKQLEIEVGRWKLRDVPAPQESLVFYLMPNPRCMRKATFKMAKHCIDLLENTNRGYNLAQEAMSCIQKSKSRTYFVDFDIDTKDVNLNLIKDILPEDCYTIIETRGGYHVLVDVRRFQSKDFYNWYNRIKEAFTVDQVQDQLLPVPGTIQGGFEVKFINL